MEHYTKDQQIREALANLITVHQCAVAEIERAMRGLNQVLEVEEVRGITASLRMSEKRGRPSVDRETLSVSWKNHTCFLGSTLLFLFIERLARSPNCYVSHLDLLEEVWGGERKSSTIRGIAKRLRDRLKEAGMGNLAKAIDGSEAGYYGLKLV